jgi:hypothetical protein
VTRETKQALDADEGKRTEYRGRLDSAGEEEEIKSFAPRAS